MLSWQWSIFSRQLFRRWITFMVLLGYGIFAAIGAAWHVLLDLSALVSSLVSLYCVFKCVASARRPGANAKAALSLAAVLAAAAIPGLTMIIGQLLTAVVGEGMVRSLLFLNAGVLMLGLLLMSLILSGSAWAEIRRDRERDRIKTRRQVTGAFISSFALVCVIFGSSEFYLDLHRREVDEIRRQDSVDARGSTSERPAAVLAAESIVSEPSEPRPVAAINNNHRGSDSGKHLETAAKQTVTSSTGSGPTASTKRSTLTSVNSRGAAPSAYDPFATDIADKKETENQNRGMGLLTAVEAVFGLAAKQPGRTARPPTPIETLKDERLNFRFRPPDAQWVAVDGKKFNRDATAAYVRRSPESFLMIIAERLGVESDLTMDGLLELSRAKMLAVAPDARQVELRPQINHGLSGMRLVQEATANGIPMHYVRWVYTNNGFAYQVILFGRASDRERIAEETDRVLAGFDQIDPKFVCHVDGATALQDFSIADDGFSLKLSDRGWQNWKDGPTVFPSAEFIALRGETALAVIPIHFDDFKPARDVRLAAFLGFFGCADPESVLAKREAIRIDKLPATECAFPRPRAEGGDVYYCLGVAQTDEFDYCISVWSTQSKQDAANALDEVLSRVHFAPVEKRVHKSKMDFGQPQRYAKYYNFVGLRYLRAQKALESEPCFLRALEFAPNMTLALENYVSACLENGRHQPALDAMEKYEVAWWDHPPSKLMHAWLLSKVNRPADAIGEFEAIFKSGTRNDDYFSAYVRLLQEAGRRDDASAAIDKYLAGGDSLVIALEKARCLSEQGKTGQAIELLKRRRQQAPGNLDVMFTLLDTLQQAERFTEAHELAKQMLAEGHESVEVLLRKGVLELQLKWYKDAKATFEIALRRSPGDERVQNYLNRVSGMLGEGSNVQLKQPLSPVELPEELRAQQPPAMPADGQAYYRSIVTAIEFVPKKSYRTSIYRSIQVLNDTGAARFSTMQFDFDPLAEKIFVNRLEVFDDQGKTISTGDAADYFVVDEGQGDVASHRKTLNVPIAGIRPGSRIEICVTKEDIVPPSAMPYVKHLFLAGSPVAREIVSVAADRQLLASNASAGLTAKTSDRGLYWQVDNLPASNFEPEAEDFDARVPFVSVVDKHCTWKSEADVYRAEIQNLMPVSEEVRKLAGNLTHYLPDRAAKIAALVDYLQQQITYKAIEFGHRARVMNSAEKTLHNRYGDCKDHSLVLCQLLQALGFNAELALVEAGGNSADATPSFDQFNHMIVCLHEDKGDRFIDATDKEGDPNQRVPFGLAGKQAMLLDWDHPRLVQIPDYPADSNAIDVERKLRIDADGVVQADDRISYKGYFASSMRHYFKAIDPGRRKTVWQAAFGGESGIQIQELGVEGLEDRQRSVVLSLKYKIPHALHLVDRQCVGRLPAPWETGIFSADRMDHRTAPLWLQLPLDVKVDIHIEPPAGYALPSAASLANSGKAGLFRCQRTAVAEVNGLQLHCEASRPAGHFPASFYADYVDQVEQARSIFTPGVVLNQRDK
jgi:tetratricopeptide (TPR) repeat protein